MGMKVLSVDRDVEVDLTIPIEDLTREMIVHYLDGEPDVIVASPVCSAWSKAGWFNHWDTKIYARAEIFVPKSPMATQSIEMVRKTIEIFSWFRSATYFMENPEGMLYKHPVIGNFVDYGLGNDLRREKVTYCKYGFDYMKPTHIWTNSKVWIPRPFCRNGDVCHTSVGRNDQGKGLKGKKDSFIRSVIPRELCIEILSTIDPAAAKLMPPVYSAAVS